MKFCEDRTLLRELIFYLQSVFGEKHNKEETLPHFTEMKAFRNVMQPLTHSKGWEKFNMNLFFSCLYSPHTYFCAYVNS